MKKGSQLTALSLLVACAGVNSCLSISNELDLNKEISLDMQIGAGGMSVPVGSLAKIYVDSLLKVGDGDIDLDTLPGGTYGISMGDRIDKVKVDIDRISINIPSPSISELKTSFDNPTPDDINVPKVSDGTVVELPSMDIDAINGKFPLISSSYQTGSYDIPGVGYTIPVDMPVSISEQSVGFSFNYTLPNDVKSLNKVWFGKTRYSKSGQTLALNVDLSGVYNVLNDAQVTIVDLRVEFPSNFTVAKSELLDSYVQSEKVSAVGNVLSISGAAISGLSAANAQLPVSFVVNNADFSSYAGEINYNDEIKYSLSLNIQGEVSFTGTRSFQVGVGIEDRLQMAEISADTKPVNFEIEPALVSSSYKVSGMDGISSINGLTFVPGNSKIYLEISDLDMDPFTFSSDGGVELQFQTNLGFAPTCKDENGNDAGTWDPETPGKLVIDLGKASGHTIELQVLSLDLSSYAIDKETKSMTIPNSIGYSGNAVIAGVTGLGLGDIQKMGNRDFNVSVWGALEIDNAELVTDAISTEIKDSTTISIDEKVDASLVALKRVDLVKPAGIDVKLDFSGIPETLPELSFSNVIIEFPDFIKMDYSGADSRIALLGDNVLKIDGALNASEIGTNGFVIEGLKIARIEFDDEIATQAGRLVLKDLKVKISGSVNADKFTVNSNELEDVAVKPSIVIDPVEVKAVYGRFSPAIEPIHQAVGLSLGDGLDFMKDGHNSLVLNDPELTLKLTSTVTIPMVANLSISSKDGNGNYIARDIRPEGGTIRIPACDSLADSRNVTILVYSSEKPVRESDDTVFVRIPNLSDLMTTIPDSIFFDMTADADQSVHHYIDLTRELSVSGSYDVTVPLSFKNVHIEYSDTIADLSDQLGDISDKIGDASLRLKAKLESTVPFGISISATPLDVNGKVIKDITIGTCQITPGNAAGTPSEVVFPVAVKNGALAALDALKIEASFDSSDSADGASLEKGQYIWLKDIVLNIPDGIVIDMTDIIDNE